MLDKVLSLNSSGRKALLDARLRENFSFKEVTGEVQIDQGQQMLVFDRIRVDGFLKVNGEAYVCEKPQIPEIPEAPKDNFSFYNVVTPKEVPANQEMVLQSQLSVSSFLRIEGRVAILQNAFENLNDDAIPNFIEAGKQFINGLNFEKYFRKQIRIEGKLVNNGFLIVGL